MYARQKSTVKSKWRSREHSSGRVGFQESQFENAETIFFIVAAADVAKSLFLKDLTKAQIINKR